MFTVDSDAYYDSIGMMLSFNSMFIISNSISLLNYYSLF